MDGVVGIPIFKMVFKLFFAVLEMFESELIGWVKGWKSKVHSIESEFDGYLWSFADFEEFYSLLEGECRLHWFICYMFYDNILLIKKII